MTKDEIEKLKALDRAPDGSCWYCKTVMRGHFDGCPVAAIPRLLEERERLLEALKLSYDEKSCWAHDVAGIAYAAIEFAEAPASKEGAPPTPPAP